MAKDAVSLVVGVDAANSTLKVYTNGKFANYRNTVKKINDAGFVYSFNKDYTMFSYNGSIYEVGDINVTGSGARGQQRYGSEDFKIETILAVALVCPSEQNLSVKLVTGVPSSLAKNEEVVAKIKAVLLGHHCVKIITAKGTREVAFDVVQVEVVAQPFGTMFDFMIDDTGEFIYPDLIKRSAIVIDIGWATLDLAIMKQGRVRATYGFEMGVVDCIAAIQERVNTEIPTAKIYSLNAHQLDCALLESTIIETPFGSFDLVRYLQEQKIVEAKKIYQKVMSLGLEFSQFYKIILTGGGALLYEEELRELFQDPRLIIKENAQLSNARGFYLFGKASGLDR